MLEESRRNFSAQGFLEISSTDDRYGYKDQFSHELYIEDRTPATVPSYGKYTISIEVEGKVVLKENPAFFELRVFNGEWRSEKFNTELCYANRTYNFTYKLRGRINDSPYKVDRPIIKIPVHFEIKSESPIQMQWIYHFKSSDGLAQVITSAVRTVAITAKMSEGNSSSQPLWLRRFKRGKKGKKIRTDMALQFAYIASPSHYSTKDGFPCNGRPYYTVGTYNTDDIVNEKIQGHGGKENLRVLDIGTADATFLTSLQKKFGLSWPQLFGISAQDYRNPKVRLTLPDSSYLCYSIENLYQLLPQIEKFSLIFSAVTWLYLHDPIGSLAIAYSLLKIGGDKSINNFV